MVRRTYRVWMFDEFDHKHAAVFVHDSYCCRFGSICIAQHGSLLRLITVLRGRLLL